MRTRARNRRRWQTQPDVNLNAFLDLVLNILLFFVFATELAVFDAIEVEVPKAEAAEHQEDKAKTVMVSISGNNEFAIDGEHVVTEGLKDAIKRHVETVAANSIIVRGDQGSDLQSTVSVLDACRGLGLDKVKIQTEMLGGAKP
jgi:biopolymer transport protein ExbD